MNRILSLSDLTIDLGNIKNIRTIPFSGNTGGLYVIIELLKGREYVFNPEIEEAELFEPQIKEGFGTIERADYFIKSITEEWNKYLKSKEDQ